MADDVPVCDVLCEAMEYLSKLGANLRNRSNTLKERKIRKDKLKNSHAVHKAAKKVLLICQLSKKSLENVENGVKKAMKLVDESQKGGKSPRDSDQQSISKDKKREVHFISYKSRMLRIAQKISLDHYTSVKVMARKMTVSFLEKYPVYHDCKLYRIRKKQVPKSVEQKTNLILSSEDSDVECQSKTETKRRPGPNKLSSKLKDSQRQIDKDEMQSNIKTEDLKLDTKIKTLKKSDRKGSDSDQLNSSKDEQISRKDSSKEDNDSETSKHSEGLKSHRVSKQRRNSESPNETKESDHSESKRLSKEKQRQSKERRRRSESQRKNKDSRSSSESQDEREKSRRNLKDKHSSPRKSQERGSKKIKTEKKEKERARRISSSSDDEAPKKKRRISNVIDSSSSEKEESKKDKASQQKEVSKKDKSPQKEENTSVINLSSDEDKSTILSPVKKNKVISSESEDPVDKNNVSKIKTKAELKDTSGNDLVDSDKEPTAKSSSEDKEPKKNGTSPIIKPAIKLVSLSKLLKPNVLQNVVQKSIVKINEQQKEKEQQKKKVRYEEDEKFWTPRREAVKAFKAKKLTVDVVKLPSFSVEFMQEHKLKKIIKNNSVIYELENESKKDEDCNRKSDKSDKSKLASADINKIKDALLNDSDSEKSVSSPADTLDSQNAKNALLDDSDAENQTNEAAAEAQQEKPDENLRLTSDQEAETTLEKDVVNNAQRDKTPEKIESTTASEVDLAKSSLLVNSEPSTPNTVDKKRQKSESVTPSKRNHIIESMHAKKMLLTYSSSESEDDQLKSVVKDIEQKLVSDEDVKNTKSTLDSDSDDCFQKRPKKKGKKSRKSKHSKSVKDKSDNDSDRDKSGSQNEDSQEKENGSDHKENSQKDDSNEKEKSPDGGAESGKDEKQKSDSGGEGDSSRKDGSKNKGDSSDNQSDSDSRRKMGRTRQKKGTSSNNSDGPDDKEIDGLANLKSLSKTRRRRDSSEQQEEKPKTRASNNKSKAKAIFASEGEGLLEASLSSDDDVSDGDNNDVEEDLPQVTVSNLNGSGGIEQLAKGDLLGSDSDESAENDKDDKAASDEDKKEENSDSEDIKSRRRKPNAITSDSETEASRSKKEPKSSDFEESGSGSDSEPKKKSKKKRKKGSDNESGSASEGKKKRRRIKSVNDSDESGSDSDNDGKNKHGRKNIRKVMGKNQLEEATKKAARQEKERVARIAERQRLYNNLQFDESGKPDEVVLDKVVLDFDPDTKEPLIEVDRGLVKKLKPHQANGIKFMWDACFESVKRIKKDKGSGCILAHCMGLGKTLQVVSLTHTLLIHSELTTVNRVLVVCPLSTVLNWVNEFKMWLEHAESSYEVDVYELSRFKQNSERAYQLTQWYKHGGVCVLGYEMFRNLSADNSKKFKKKMLKQFQESLVDPGPDMVVCDEGHLLKNEKTSLSQSMNRVKTHRRIVLTGTPLQNNLKEYYCMVTFVKPNLLGKYNEYLNRFVNPITNGQYTDSTEHDIKIMKRRSHVLHKMLDGAVQRRDYGVLAPFLPPKHEYVLFITLTDIQIKLYQHYLENYSRRPQAGKSSGFLFPDFQSLQRIWTHPLVLKYNSERYEIMLQKKRDKEEEEDSEGSLIDFIDDDSTPAETSSEDSSDIMSDISDSSRKKSKKKKAKKSKAKESRATKRTTRANAVDLDDEVLPELPAEVKNDNPTEWWIPLVTEDELEDLRNSHKLVLLFEILRQCEAIGDKLLVFSQSLYSLDLIEHFLGKVDEATQEGRIDEKLGGHVGSWSPGIDYFRLDGSTSCENRSIWCKNFNREDNPRARLFLISTRAGGLGINLVAANRVIIFDVSWNPSHDVQSIFRVYRFGQKKPCYVYRFLAMGTMEEKIYERQVTKQAISKRVIDEQQIDRHYAENDLAELYNFEPVPPQPRPVPPVPKDRFFAEMLKDHAKLIYKFHEHDSLLENKEEETLSEEERKAAWEDFENEKNRPPPTPFANWPMHNGMMPGLQLAQQQQQLAYAALGAVLRKDMPNLTEDQIRGMIPLIYSANPALMQKLNDMYKYTAPGMMNPALMNPALMTPGGAAMGSSSGLQYEPPWQRQQQTQQQMRLQQLMQQQQQNQMGAKLYAGGLGSRDPVAMALQQQRAREIMLGEQGRPRGRPPGSTRATPRPPQGDVVNLDSD